MAKRKKNWSKIIRVGELDVRLYERTNGASVYLSYRLDGTKHQKSTKRSDRTEAEVWARAHVEEVLAERNLGRTGEPITLGELFRAYFKWKAPTLSKAWAKTARTRSELFLEAWGADMLAGDVSQSHVDRYSAQRSSGALSPFEEGGKGREPTGVRDGTLDGDFRWLSSVYNWARGHKVEGERLILENPLHDVEWPKEKNPLRPVASHDRFLATMKHVDDVDPEGRLRCILALARYAGRRESAICELRADDVLRTKDAVRRSLAASGMDERIAEHMPHGAIRWSDESDKVGLLRIAPLSERAREAVDDYLRQNPRVGAVPLFPAPEDPEKPIRRDTAATWLLRAEKAAGLPKLKRGGLPPVPSSVGERAKAPPRRRRGRGRRLEGHSSDEAELPARGPGDRVQGGGERRMIFTGTIYGRSSKGRGGPPGESEVMDLNPGRAVRIREATGWTRVERGSLNLLVEPTVVDQLADLEPALAEPAEAIQYPARYAHIPELRGGYWYFEGVARAGEIEEPVLVRRAIAKPLPKRVELYAPVHLKDRLGVDDGDSVEVEVAPSPSEN